MKELEDALAEFGAPWEIDGFTFSHPSDCGRYVAVLDTVESDGPDDRVMFLRHSVSLELYDNGTRADVEARIELSRILDARNLRHTRNPSVFLKEVKKAMTVYELDGWIEKGIFHGERDDATQPERDYGRVL